MGFPAPLGEANVTVTGANALIDGLIATGLITEDDAMGARMMMGMFMVPSGDDSLTSGGQGGDADPGERATAADVIPDRGMERGGAFRSRPSSCREVGGSTPTLQGLRLRIPSGDGCSSPLRGKAGATQVLADLVGDEIGEKLHLGGQPSSAGAG